MFLVEDDDDDARSIIWVFCELKELYYMFMVIDLAPVYNLFNLIDFYSKKVEL